MKKILILGNSSSGKSTLAKELSLQNNLAHLDLDTIAWDKGTVTQRANIEDSEKQLHKFINENKSWVIEGCYTDLLKLVEEYASKIIFLNLDVSQCINNANKRPWEPHKYKSKEDQDKNLDILINWIKDYYARDDVFSYKQHMEFYEKFEGEKIILDKTKNNSPRKSIKRYKI